MFEIMMENVYRNHIFIHCDVLLKENVLLLVLSFDYEFLKSAPIKTILSGLYMKILFNFVWFYWHHDIFNCILSE